MKVRIQEFIIKLTDKLKDWYQTTPHDVVVRVEYDETGISDFQKGH